MHFGHVTQRPVADSYSVCQKNQTHQQTGKRLVSAVAVRVILVVRQW